MRLSALRLQSVAENWSCGCENKKKGSGWKLQKAMGLAHCSPILEGKYKWYTFMWIFSNSLNSSYNSFKKENKVLLFKHYWNRLLTKYAQGQKFHRSVNLNFK